MNLKSLHLSQCLQIWLHSQSPAATAIEIYGKSEHNLCEPLSQTLTYASRRSKSAQEGSPSCNYSPFDFSSQVKTSIHSFALI